MPGTDKRLETGWYSLSVKVTLCLFLLDCWNQALIGLSDISRVIERVVVKVMSMMRVSINQVLKLIFSFTDMSVLSYKKSKVNVLLASLQLFEIYFFAICLLNVTDDISERWVCWELLV